MLFVELNNFCNLTNQRKGENPSYINFFTNLKVS